jgi:hypothetical protein
MLAEVSIGLSGVLFLIGAIVAGVDAFLHKSLLAAAVCLVALGLFFQTV